MGGFLGKVELLAASPTDFQGAVNVGQTNVRYRVRAGDALTPWHTLEARPRPRAVELDPEGRVLDRFGGFGTGPGEFQLGHDITVARDGSVYVADAAGKRVQKFTRQAAKP